MRNVESDSTSIPSTPFLKSLSFEDRNSNAPIIFGVNNCPCLFRVLEEHAKSKVNLTSLEVSLRLLFLKQESSWK